VRRQSRAHGEQGVKAVILNVLLRQRKQSTSMGSSIRRCGFPDTSMRRAGFPVSMIFLAMTLSRWFVQKEKLGHAVLDMNWNGAGRG
jgi:hypothetical protein